MAQLRYNKSVRTHSYGTVLLSSLPQDAGGTAYRSLCTAMLDVKFPQRPLTQALSLGAYGVFLPDHSAETVRQVTVDPETKMLTLYGEREKDTQAGAGALRHLERHFGVFVRHVQARFHAREFPTGPAALPCDQNLPTLPCRCFCYACLMSDRTSSCTI